MYDVDDILLNVWNKEDNADVFSINMNLVENEIKKRAYHYWENAGQPFGRDLEFWFKAEKEINSLLGIYFSKEPSDSHLLTV